MLYLSKALSRLLNDNGQLGLTPGEAPSFPEEFPQHRRAAHISTAPSHLAPTRTTTVLASIAIAICRALRRRPPIGLYCPAPLTCITTRLPAVTGLRTADGSTVPAVSLTDQGARVVSSLFFRALTGVLVFACASRGQRGSREG